MNLSDSNTLGLDSTNPNFLDMDAAQCIGHEEWRRWNLHDPIPIGSYDYATSDPGTDKFAPISQGSVIASNDGARKPDTVHPFWIVAGLDGQKQFVEIQNSESDDYERFESAIEENTLHKIFSPSSCFYQCEQQLIKMVSGWDEEFHHALWHLAHKVLVNPEECEC